MISILSFCLILLLSLYCVPMARRAALSFIVVDRPDGRLKQHQAEPMPYFGGLAFYLAFLISLALTFEFRQAVLGLILADTLMLRLGLIDDFGVLSPWAKLIGQLIVVADVKDIRYAYVLFDKHRALALQKPLIVVSYTQRGDRTRIINARLMDRKERVIYEEG
ncbi:MAG: hypothetical protein HY730_00945 [Candidatus Tectomicrobia bacterium]|uniref:Undecaprenyl/decaprenyl-phosphate alpha-N-acetylglucosaminyl 1-phosphate transferase n=1 Tax=Tectimicrobiota bacterium TaxID=2528274 RepID=A0A933LPA3_UNCTE|nr:hypothetical protein [Candidatus Tectomicrobia bacterium]